MKGKNIYFTSKEIIALYLTIEDFEENASEVVYAHRLQNGLGTAWHKMADCIDSRELAKPKKIWCEKCESGDCCERTDLIGEPVLCDDCYTKEIYGECNCDACLNGYYEGDKLRCKVDKCNPKYEI